MASIDKIEARAIKQLMRDVSLYSNEKNKDAKYAIYVRARDVAFKLRKLYADQAPEKEELDNLGYNVKVRAALRERYKIKHDGSKGAYKGAVNYKVKGVRITNKRARAVHAELGIRRRSRLWLRNALPILPVKKQEMFFKALSNLQVAKTKTRVDKRGTVVGDAVLNTAKKNSSIRITSRADSADEVSDANGNLVTRAVLASSRDVRNYLARTQRRAVGRTLKKVYKS